VTDTIGDQQEEFARASAAVNCFAFDLYQHYLQEEGNLLLSPLSIATALAMAYAGADGETAVEMKQVLYLGAEPGVHDSFRALLDSLGGEEDLFELEVANALWPREGFPFHNSYFNQVAADYHGYAQPLDYRQPDEAAQIVNDWVSGQTRGKITDLIDPSNLSNAVMLLTNSIYFKAFWQGPFDPEYTEDRAFTLTDGSTVTVPTMHFPSGWTDAANEFRYTSFDGLEALEMPFKDRQTSMVIAVPEEGDVQNLSPGTLIDLMDWLDHSAPQPDCEQLGVVLPKFETTVSSDLNDVLPGMGISSAFNPGAADFSKMTDSNIWIGDVQHKATIEVNEQGTEAAAATSISFFLCFPAGTPVRTRDGDKPIEQIRAGDYVLSRSEFDHESEVRFQRVEETFEGHATLLQLQLGAQSIRTTAEHRFFARDRGWVSAAELVPGDALATDSDVWQSVEAIDIIEVAEPVFNFRVAEDHTYFVGEQAWGFAIWTHNCYEAPQPPVFTVDRPFHYFIRDNTTRSLLFMGRVSDPTQLENDLKPTVATQELIPGDANGDNKVAFDDFLVLAENFARADATWEHGDFDRDGLEQFSDFLILAENFGQVREPAAVSPNAPLAELCVLESSTSEIQATDAILAGFDDVISNDGCEKSLDVSTGQAP
jgi:serpin B